MHIILGLCKLLHTDNLSGWCGSMLDSLREIPLLYCVYNSTRKKFPSNTEYFKGFEDKADHD